MERGLNALSLLVGVPVPGYSGSSGNCVSWLEIQSSERGISRRLERLDVWQATRRFLDALDGALSTSTPHWYMTCQRFRKARFGDSTESIWRPPTLGETTMGGSPEAAYEEPLARAATDVTSQWSSHRCRCEAQFPEYTNSAREQPHIP